MAKPFRLVRFFDDAENPFGIAVAVNGTVYHRVVSDRSYADFLVALHNARYKAHGKDYVLGLIGEGELSVLREGVILYLHKYRIAEILAAGI